MLRDKLATPKSTAGKRFSPLKRRFSSLLSPGNFMVYYRLCDIKTPPFAYVLNKDEVLHSCKRCEMPSLDLRGDLEIEICMTEDVSWESILRGRPLMADHWLIGDEWFSDALEDMFPDGFTRKPVKVVSWLTREIHPNGPAHKDMLKVRRPDYPPLYFYFRPKRELPLASDLAREFPSMHCNLCGRDIPDIPIDYQPLPEKAATGPTVASLHGFYLDGYDYLFHHEAYAGIESQFPGMILEKLPLP